LQRELGVLATQKTRRIRGKRARARQRPLGRDLRDRYREGDLPPAPDLAVVEFDDPYAGAGWINPEGTLDPEARLKSARRADGSIAAGEPEWVAPSRPRIRAVARLKEDPIGRMHARHQIDRAQFLGGRQYQELYDATQRGHVRSVDLEKTRVMFGPRPDPLTDAQQRASRRLQSVNQAVLQRHGETGLALAKAVLGERHPIEKTARAYGAVGRREVHSVAWLFRQALTTIAKALGFITSTRRPYQAPTSGVAEADPADDPGRHADDADLADSRLRSAHRQNGRVP
jgi:hypothetical protein